MIWLAIMLIAVPMFFLIGAAIFEIHIHRDPLPRAMSALAPRHHRDPSIIPIAPIRPIPRPG